jgi:hypothetical protein
MSFYSSAFTESLLSPTKPFPKISGSKYKLMPSGFQKSRFGGGTFETHFSYRQRAQGRTNTKPKNF